MWFDIACCIIIAVGFVMGFRRGFLAQLSSIAGVILGVICCRLFAEKVAQYFTAPDAAFATILLINVLSYVIIFILCYVTCRLVGSLLAGGFKALHLGFANRLCGAVFTTLEYTLVFSMALNAWTGVFPDTAIDTDYKGVRRFVLNFAPTVLGSPTVAEIVAAVNAAGQPVSTEPESV